MASPTTTASGPGSAPGEQCREVLAFLDGLKSRKSYRGSLSNQCCSPTPSLLEIPTCLSKQPVPPMQISDASYAFTTRFHMSLHRDTFAIGQDLKTFSLLSEYLGSMLQFSSANHSCIFYVTCLKSAGKFGLELSTSVHLYIRLTRYLFAHILFHDKLTDKKHVHGLQRKVEFAVDAASGLQQTQCFNITPASADRWNSQSGSEIRSFRAFDSIRDR